MCFPSWLNSYLAASDHHPDTLIMTELQIWTYNTLQRYSDILSGILSGVYPDILSDTPIWQFSLAWVQVHKSQYGYAAMGQHESTCVHPAKSE